MSAIALCPNCREPVAASSIEVGGNATCPSCGADLSPPGVSTSGFEPLTLDYEEPSYNSRDLPAARENIPRPAARPAARRPQAPQPLPADLVMSRENPQLDDLLFGDDDPTPTDPSPGGEEGQREGIDLGIDLTGNMDFQTQQQPAAPRPAPAPVRGNAPAPGRPAAPGRSGPVHSPDRLAAPTMQGLDIFLGELPSAGGSPLAPLDFGPPSTGAAPPTEDDQLLGMREGPVDIGSMLDSMLSAPGAAAPSSAPPAGPPQMPSGPPPGLFDDLPPPSSAAVMRSSPPAAADPAPADSGFALTLDDGAHIGDEPRARAPVVVPPPSTSTGLARSSESLPEGVQWMAAPRRRADQLEDRAAPRSRRRLLLIAGGAVAVVGAGVAVALGVVGGRGGPEGALAPFAADLARDHFPAYEAAAQAVAAEAGDDALANAQAAELLLTAVLGRGAEKTKLGRAEELLTKVPAAGELPPAAGRARALMAVARSRGGEVDGLLGAQASTPEGQLVTGLRRLRERKSPQALAALRAAAAAPGRLLPVYLLGRALEDAGQLEEARASYLKVLAGNPEHAGALVGTARMEPQKAAARLAAAEKLQGRVAATGSPVELGEAKALRGEALLALGRTAEAVTTLGSAATSSPQSVNVQAALAEALIADGRAGEALARLSSGDPALLTSAVGRLALGSALVASGKVTEGAAQLGAVAAEMPSNPRLPFWQGVAAEGRKPADDAGAEAGYRRALSLDPAFLPASLRLAALLQRQGKAEKAIALIKEAERAGAPAEALELAWGQALIEAKNPGEAITVFRKSVARAPKLAAARVGLASALEAAGQVPEAEAELGRAIADLSGASGLRERLADVLLRQGKKAEALAHLEGEATANPGNRSVRVRVAKLALELGQADRAAREAGAVVAEDPATPEALFTLGRAHEALGNIGGALQDYKRATALETSSDLHLAYGQALSRQGREDDALGQLTSAGDRPLARLERGRIHLRRGEIAEALQHADAAARLEPTMAAAHFLRGQCLDLLGRADDAATAWKAALRVEPKLAEAHYRLGRHEMDKGRQAAALGYFRQATALQPQKVPWLPDLLFQLGFAEAQGGSRGNAATALKRYLEVAPRDAPARPEAERELARLVRR